MSKINNCCTSNLNLRPRETKFRARAWQDDLWIIGGGVEYFGEHAAMIAKDDDGELIIYKVASKTVFEFTGLKDKNGQEIYEGDILNIYEQYEQAENEDMGNHVVVWGGSDYPAFTLKLGLGTEMNELSYLKLAADYNEKFEIIGNIIETPELLE